MKAFIIGLAAAAIALLTAGGIKAALPGIQTDPAPSCDVQARWSRSCDDTV